MSLNSIIKVDFKQAVLNSLKLKQGKSRNVMIVGHSNYTKNIHAESAGRNIEKEVKCL